MKIIIPSCDKFKPVWRPMLELMDKFWPDRPWPRVIISGTALEDGLPECEVVCTGDDSHWGRHLSQGIGHARVDSVFGEDDAILLVLDDFLFTAPVDTKVMESLAGRMMTSDVQYLRAVPTPECNDPIEQDSLCGYIKPGTEYRCSLQASFWRASYLQRLCELRDNPWDFEVRQRGDSSAIHMAVRRHVRPLSYTDAYRRGKLRPEAVALCEAEGVTCPVPI